MEDAIIFDFNRTLFDPMTYALYPGAASMLEDLKANKRLFLYSRRAHDRKKLLEDLGIDEHFEAMYFVADKNADGLREILTSHGLDAGGTTMVGDALWDELSIGNAVGTRTVWLKQSIFSHAAALADHFEPTYTVGSIEEMHRLLKGDI